MRARRRTAKRLTAICVAMALAAAATATEPLEVGFERTELVPEKTGLQTTMSRAGWTFDTTLRLPAGWRPNPGVTRNGEYRLITDPAEAHGGKHCIYLRGHLMMSRSAVAAGDEIELRFYAKDPAKGRVAAVLYTYRRDGQGKHRFITTLPFFTAQADNDWTECSGKTTVPEMISGKRVNAVIVVLVSTTGAHFDDVKQGHTRTDRYRNVQDAIDAGRREVEHAKFDQARRDFRKALELAETDSERAECLSRIAEAYHAEKRYSEAAAALNRILDLEQVGEEEELAIRNRIADAHIAAGAYEKARAALRKLLDMTPDTDAAEVELLLKIGDCYAREKEYEQAAKAMAKVLDMPQADCLCKVATQFRIASACVSARAYDKARQAFQDVLAMPGVSVADRFEVWKSTGDTHRAEGRRAKARDAYRKALAVGDVNPYSEASVMIAIGDTLKEEKRYAEARAAYSELAEMDTPAWQSRVLAYKRVGEAYRGEGAYVEEREQYAAMLQFVRTRPRCTATDLARAKADALLLSGDSFWAQGRREEATQHYVRWLEVGAVTLKAALRKHVEARIGANETAACIRRGEALFAEGKYPAARAEFEKALAARGASARQRAVAHIHRGECFLAERRLDKARSELEAALGVDGAGQATEAEARTRLADCCAVAGHYDEARTEYAKILAMSDVPVVSRADAQAMIAALYRAEHQFERARGEYEEILEMKGVGAEYAARIAQRIRTIYR